MLKGFPAAIEETVFRHGIVQAAFSLFGEWTALSMGSIPFGLLHLIGTFFGQPISLLQVVGISLGGLLLSLTYFRWGFAAAFGLHLLWNTFSVQWALAMGLDMKTGAGDMESAWSTILILLFFCIALIFYRKKMNH